MSKSENNRETLIRVENVLFGVNVRNERVRVTPAAVAVTV